MKNVCLHVLKLYHPPLFFQVMRIFMIRKPTKIVKDRSLHVNPQFLSTQVSHHQLRLRPEMKMKMRKHHGGLCNMNAC